ncbi:MAG: ureidoglycolate lyase [Alphaproteobacteria bacterium]|nr:ureidoglycolate lyase [Alphaproteobacteria bacterium]MDE2336228.1 ureidoglycolate lyase [Alphaproteobacteria bacterium]
MNPRVLKPEPLTAAAFAPYGDVISCNAAKEQRSINYGNTARFHDLARLDLTAEAGRATVSIFRSTPVPRPIDIKIMERHPLSSQAFYPLSGRPYMVVVTPKGDFSPGKLKAFLAGPDQGVNYHAGTWHHYSLALDAVSDFLVIDRDGPGENCDEIAVENTRVDY